MRRFSSTISDSIAQTIIDKLLPSEFVIADISGHNPN